MWALISYFSRFQSHRCGSLGCLVLAREHLMQTISAALSELTRINSEIDALSLHTPLPTCPLASGNGHVSPAPAEDTPEPAEPVLRPLTEDHRRLLRLKSFSFPFLCDDAWYKVGSDQLSCSLDNGEVSDSDGSDGDFLAWNTFWAAQETSIGAEDNIIL